MLLAADALDQRAAPAMLAISLRRAAVNAFALASPPALANLSA